MRCWSSDIMWQKPYFFLWKLLFYMVLKRYPSKLRQCHGYQKNRLTLFFTPKEELVSYDIPIRFYGRKREKKLIFEKNGSESRLLELWNYTTNPCFFVENFFSDRSEKFSTHPTPMSWVSKEPPRLVLYVRKKLGACDKLIKKYRRKTRKKPYFQKLPFEPL